MTNEKILRYIREARKKKVPMIVIRKNLISAGWKEHVVDDALRHSKKRAPVFLIISVLLVFILAGFYFMVLSPSNVPKPEITLPPSQADINDSITNNHVEYIVNELGGYNLHNDPFTGEKPVIEFVVQDIKESYTVIIENNIPKVNDEKIEPDLKISGDLATILKLCKSKTVQSDIVPLVKEGNIQIEIISDEKTLALKGYKSIYDSLNSGMPTGKVIRLA